MRIIGGEFRGRALAGLGKGDADAHLRPTTDRIRESLFNVLAGAYGDPVDGAVVLDLFAGTGALGLEAVSRGAQSVTFVENGRKSQAILKRNIELCQIQDRSHVLRCDARRLPKASQPADLVFLDPPYGKGLGELALVAALKTGWIASGALIIWEESAAVKPPEGVCTIETRKFGTTSMTFLRYSAGDPGHC